MRIQTAQLVSLGYGRYVRSDEVVAVEPITDGRGPGRRSLVWVRNVPDPFVSSRSEAAIIADLMRPAEEVRATAVAVRAQALGKSRERRPPEAKTPRRARGAPVATRGAARKRPRAR